MRTTELIPLLCPKGTPGGGAKAASSSAPKKRMIADADSAVIDDSFIPEPLCMYVATLATVGTGAVLCLGVAFKAVEFALLVALPAVALVWGLSAALWADWTHATLELGAHSAEPATVQLAGAVAALAAYACLAAGTSGCARTKAKVLPLVAVLAAACADSPLFGSTAADSAWASAPVLCGACTAKQLLVAVPALAALANSQAFAFTAYFEKNQKAAVEMAKKVKRNISYESLADEHTCCCCAHTPAKKKKRRNAHKK
jgi:Flp pilus assembly pilin Flp